MVIGPSVILSHEIPMRKKGDWLMKSIVSAVLGVATMMPVLAFGLTIAE
jgi:hypothetical protein